MDYNSPAHSLPHTGLDATPLIILAVVCLIAAALIRLAAAR